MPAHNIFIAHPVNTDQINALKAVVKALKIKFEVAKETKKPYNKDFVNMILKGDEDFKQGKFKTIKTKNLWK